MVQCQLIMEIIPSFRAIRGVNFRQFRSFSGTFAGFTGTAYEGSGLSPGIEQDAVWMLAHQAGSVAAFEMLLLEHRTPLITYLIRFVRNRAIAEELAQDVLLRVYRTRNYQPTAKFRSWLF